MADLSVRVRLNTTPAINSLNRLQNAINKLNNATNSQNNQVNQVARGYSKVQRNVNQVTRAQQQTTAATKDFWKTLRHVASTYMSILALARLTGTAIAQADTYISTRNKLNAMNADINGDAGVGGYSAETFEATDEAIRKMYMSSQRVRTSFTSMANNVGKSMTLAGEAFDNNIDNAIRFNEIMAETYALSGASTYEISSSMYQLTQALASGILQGDELRSVREGAPMAYKAIERFAQEVYGTTESLKELGSQGKITSDIVVAAILGMGAQADAAFANTQTTFAQAGTMLGNALYNAFIPVFNELMNLLNSETGAAVMNGIMWIINMLAEASLIIVQIVSSVITWIVENWSWLQYVFYTIITALMIWIGKLAVTAVMAAAPVILAWLKAVIPYLLIAAAIVFLIGVIIHLANTAASGAEFIQQVVMILAAVCIAAAIAVGLITGNVVLFWVLLIVGILLMLVGFISACGEEVGRIIGIFVAGIYNMVVGLIDGILQIVFSAVEPFIGVWEWILNICQGGFDSFGGAVANLIGQIISWFLSLGKVVTKIIDAIFGSNWTAGLTSLQNEVLSWGKNENAITLNHEAPTVSSITGGWLPSRIDPAEAADVGGNIGADLQNAINGFGVDAQLWTQDFGEKFSSDNVGQFHYDGNALAWNPESMGFNAPTLGEIANGGSASPWLNTTVPTISPVSPDSTDKTLKTGGSTPSKKLGSKVDKISDNTDSIADSMELTQEDLEYLRKLATLEWKKEFTTAHIQVDMSNYNTVNNNDDLDGIATRLADKLYEELDAVANGVYV